MSVVRNFLVPINLNHLDLQNATIHLLAAPPGNPVAGQVYYDTAKLALFVFNGTAWVNADATQVPLNTVAAPVASVSLAGYQINLLAAPTVATDAANKGYVDAGDATLAASVTAEATRAGNAEASLATSVATEATRAGNAESSLSTAITNLGSSGGAAVAAEQTRALAAEATLAASVATEASRAGDAETSLATSVATEATRAGNAEATLTANLASEASTARSNEGSLGGSIASEASRAKVQKPR
jgi:hypothetical protein